MRYNNNRVIRMLPIIGEKPNYNRNERHKKIPIWKKI
jgi:hypothetical protein